MSQVDVLVVAALPLEFESVVSVLGDAVAREEVPRSSAVPYVSAEIDTSSGRLSIALARPSRMSGRGTGVAVGTLVDALEPACLAMCGVCAGNPARAAPGDVIIADPAFQYDEGKQRGPEFLGDLQMFPLEERWLRAAQDLDPVHPSSYCPPTEDEAITWLLERLLLAENPRAHPARQRYFAARTWQSALDAVEAEGLISRLRTGEAVLTRTGRAQIERSRYDSVDGPRRLPFGVLAGPLASGNAVMQDPEVWARLQRMGTRTILGLDMEAATIATVAHQKQVPHWLVAKGVMDGAELDRDDRFKAFAARASAEVLFELLGRLMKPSSDGSRPSAGLTNGNAVNASVKTGTPFEIPGAVKVQVLRRLVDDWSALADYIEIPAYARSGFGPGEGPRGVWDWLDARLRLAELPAALTAIGRDDLAELVRPYVR